MVLSNKKLKHRLRAAKAELITASGAENTFSDKKYEKSQNIDSKASDSLRTIRDLEAQRSRLPKRARPKRVKQRLPTLTENGGIVENGKISGGVELQLQDGLNSDTMQVEKEEKKKRKRDESETQDGLNSDTMQMDNKKKTKKTKRDESESSENVKEKRKKKKKRPRYWWLEKRKTKDKIKTEEVETGVVKEEGVNQNENGSIGKQLVAKTDESIDSDRKNVEMSQKVYVGGIPYYSTEDDIRSYFEGCGTITSIDCMTFSDTGKFRGIAIITFKTEAATKRALALDGSDMGGLFLKIQPFKSAKVNKLPNFSPTVLEGYNRIYVGNLSWDITEDDLRNIFSDCTIKSIRFGEDKETREFKGYAHVDFADSLSLNTALKLDQTVVCGRPVRITCAVPKKDIASESKHMPEANQVAGGKVDVTTAIIKVTPEDVQVASGYVRAAQAGSGYVRAAVENHVSSSGTNAALTSKIRRRTCYECGERGHLSSACPKVTGERGHLSSACPKVTPEDVQVEVASGYVSAAQVANGYVSAAVENQVSSSGTNAALTSKIRRRTCYECGERGHLSSACPKVTQEDVKVASGYVSAAQVANGYVSAPQVANEYVSAAVENQVSSSGTNAALSSKIRRRTCYECGERGHLSSDCPKKQAADATNPGTT